MVYDDTEQEIQKVCNDNDITEADLIEMLMEYLDEAKENNGLR
jgi:hypothetical protein